MVTLAGLPSASYLPPLLEVKFDVAKLWFFGCVLSSFFFAAIRPFTRSYVRGQKAAPPHLKMGAGILEMSPSTAVMTSKFS
ncbi:MAG: hypothetical protein CRN43_13520 [Candidatus Nephrothrix sp. EaCA]|nr:MAG: hypothetical protein CRN43_13520 [Candidatus Nephrothrix sp. EaCA]